jgi:Domain of unknown function (DUF5710)
LISIRTIRDGDVQGLISHLFGNAVPTQPRAPSIDLNVPFSEKDEAKRLGARWNAERKKWFVPAGVNSEPFKRWVETKPEPVARSVTQTMLAPVWLLTSTENCYRCHKISPVFAIASKSIEDYDIDEYDDVHYQTHRADENTHVSISNLENVDERIGQYLAKFAPKYRMDFSKTQSANVYMNHCHHCGAKLGDFYMHNEPGGAFFPDSYEDSQRLKRVMFESGQYSVQGSIGLTGF